MTAAHCVHLIKLPCPKQKNQQYKCMVKLGEHNRSVPGIAEEGFNNSKVLKIKVNQVLKHPEYHHNHTTHQVYHDIALLRLETPVDFARFPNIRPACLPTDLSQDYLGRTAIIAGWGAQNQKHESDGSKAARMHFVYDYFRSISLVAMSWVWSLPLIILLTLQLSRIEGNSPTPSPHPPSYQPTPLHYPTAETSPSYRAVSTLQPYPSPRPTYRPAFSPTAAAPTQYPTLYTSHQTHRSHQEDTSPGYSRPARPLPPACTALRHYVVMLQNAVEESVCRHHYDKKIIRKHGKTLKCNQFLNYPTVWQATARRTSV